MSPKVFWPGVVLGWSVMLVGFVGVAGEGRDVPVRAFGRWVIGTAVLHDLLLVPLGLLVGIVLRRALGPPWRAIVGAGLVVAGPVILFAWPYAAGWGRSRSNASIQPRDYGAGLTVLLLAIVTAAILLTIAAAVRRARAR